MTTDVDCALAGPVTTAGIDKPVANYFDRAPAPMITATQVHAMRAAIATSLAPSQKTHEMHVEVLRGLLAHPGVSSSARAVIEAALE